LQNFVMPSDIPDDQYPPPSAFVEEGKNCVEAAQKEGLILRVMGGLGIYMHSQEFQPLWEGLARLGKKMFTDIDYVSYDKHRVKMLKFLEGRGFSVHQKLLYLYGKERQIYYGDRIPMVEVFYDRLAMNHIVNFAKRLEQDSPTVPLSELLLQKLQMVRMNEKDIKDSILLLRAHNVADHDNNSINYSVINSVLASDWGFYHTATNNLNKINQSLGNYPVLTKEDRDIISERVKELLEKVESAPKSLKWKARARLGTKVIWYDEVDEWDIIETLPEGE